MLYFGTWSLLKRLVEVPLQKSLRADSENDWLQGTKLSEKEQRELDYKTEVYELAKKRQDQEAAIRNREEYRMPDSYDDANQVKQDERMKLLTKRFE